MSYLSHIPPCPAWLQLVHRLPAWPAAALVLLLAGQLDAQAQVQAQAPARPADAAGEAAAALQAQVQGQVQTQVQMMAASQIPAPGGARIEVLPGTLDARLKLAPCSRIEPYLPAGARLWGATRVGLRCSAGAVRWNVYLPVTVKIWAQAVVAAAPLAAGTELTARNLMLAEVDIAAAASPTFERADLIVGRRLASALAAGVALRADMLRAHQWFAAGDPVSVIARGDGFAVSGAGEALGPGLEGQNVRVRTDNGRIVVGLPVGERRVEIKL
jgi:flagella basal body P-ring formation protein FlgA